MLVDLDHFTQVNDTEGHLIGGAVLSVVAARLRSACGTSGMVARWGGEEFVVVVPGGDAREVAALAERLRSGVGSNPLQVGTVQPRPGGGFVGLRPAQGPALCGGRGISWETC
jgi:diguanylate cyclase (GGDEF)-like protein